MDLINLITQNPISFIAVLSLSFNAFLLHRLQINAEKIGAFQSSITNKDHELQRLLSERKDIQESHKNSIININNKHEGELSELAKENTELNHRENLRISSMPNSFEPEQEEF